MSFMTPAGVIKLSVAEKIPIRYTKCYRAVYF